MQKKNKIYLEEEDPDSEMLHDVSAKKKKKVIKRGTIFDEIIKRKGHIEMAPDSDCASLKSEKPKRIRQRSTIMPIFLKKIKERRQMEEGLYEEEGACFISVSGSVTSCDQKGTLSDDVISAFDRLSSCGIAQLNFEKRLIWRDGARCKIVRFLYRVSQFFFNSNRNAIWSSLKRRKFEYHATFRFL